MNLFIAQFLICASSMCFVFEEEKPPVFTKEQNCLDHAERVLHEKFKSNEYTYAFVRCKLLKSENV